MGDNVNVDELDKEIFKVFLTYQNVPLTSVDIVTALNGKIKREQKIKITSKITYHLKKLHKQKILQKKLEGNTSKYFLHVDKAYFGQGKLLVDNHVLNMGECLALNILDDANIVIFLDDV